VLHVELRRQHGSQSLYELRLSFEDGLVFPVECGAFEHRDQLLEESFLEGRWLPRVLQLIEVDV
jgi:hypothetical protein